MPPKSKFTRNEIVNIAMDIVREKGIDAVTARELAKRLDSSARPIFTVFSGMDEVRNEIIIAAKAIYKEYINDGLKQDIAFKGVGAAYIRFSIMEPKLFQLLFMNEIYGSNDLNHIMSMLDDSYDDILKSVQEIYCLSIDEAKRLYQHIWIYTHGIASLCATKVCSFTMNEISCMLTEVFRSLFCDIKKGEQRND